MRKDNFSPSVPPKLATEGKGRKQVSLQPMSKNKSGFKVSAAHLRESQSSEKIGGENHIRTPLARSAAASILIRSP